MKILVFDTCFNKTYIVLKDDEKIIESEVISSTDENYHSVFLIPQIRDMLVKNSLKFEDIDALGVNIGPGSFTGIRAGITIARVLAQQTNIKLVGVPSLEILARINNSDKNTVVVTDARKNKVYFARYSKTETLVEPRLVEKDELISNLTDDDVVISDKSIGSYLDDNNVNHIVYEENDEKLGEYLIDIVSKKLEKAEDDYNWAKVKPLYIQLPSITKPKEVKNV